MNWFKVTVNDGSKDGYTYVGSSNESLEAIIHKANGGVLIRLDNLLYRDSGEIFSWEQWDSSLIPTAYINPKTICTVMQFKDDPRNFTAKTQNHF